MRPSYFASDSWNIMTCTNLGHCQKTDEIFLRENGSMQETASHRSQKFENHLRAVNPAKLESAARTYIWLAEFGPEEVRTLYGRQRDACLKEYRRRGLA